MEKVIAALVITLIIMGIIELLKVANTSMKLAKIRMEKAKKEIKDYEAEHRS